MKTKITVAAVALISSLAFAQNGTMIQVNPSPDFRPGDEIKMIRDLRIVNGMKVDLTDLHKWYLKPEGERPLKHWKKLQVMTPKEDIGGWQRCILKTEEGSLLEALIANLPPETITYVRSLKELQQRIAQLRAEVEANKAVVRREDAVTATGASGPGYYVDALMSQRAQVNLDAVTLKEKQEALETLEKSYDQLLVTSAQSLSLFAMFTGRNYGGLQVWDCGRLSR